jgi:hypothetical protein
MNLCNRETFPLLSTPLAVSVATPKCSLSASLFEGITGISFVNAISPDSTPDIITTHVQRYPPRLLHVIQQNREELIQQRLNSDVEEAAEVQSVDLILDILLRRRFASVARNGLDKRYFETGFTMR